MYILSQWRQKFTVLYLQLYVYLGAVDMLKYSESNRILFESSFESFKHLHTPTQTVGTYFFFQFLHMQALSLQNGVTLHNIGSVKKQKATLCTGEPHANCAITVTV